MCPYCKCQSWSNTWGPGPVNASCAECRKPFIVQWIDGSLQAFKPAEVESVLICARCERPAELCECLDLCPVCGLEECAGHDEQPY